MLFTIQGGAVMETLGEVMDKLPSAVQHSREKSETAHRQVFLQTEGSIRSDIALAEGWTVPKQPPPPEHCAYCGRTLYYYGIKHFISAAHSVIAWFDAPERCTCERAKAYWQQQDRLKAQTEAEKLRKQEAEQLQRRVARLIRDSGIRGRFANRTFEKFEVNQTNRKAYERCKRYADSFLDIMMPGKDGHGNVIPPQKERNGLFITGSYGTGKTHLASAIANQLMQNGTPVICMTMIDLLGRIKSSFDTGKGATEAEIIKLYEEIPLLIIDDIGSEQPTEWGITQIYSIINARYESYMPTIITTNYSADDLIQRMTPAQRGKSSDLRNAEKTLDRLREMCVGIEMKWESWRVKT